MLFFEDDTKPVGTGRKKISTSMVEEIPQDFSFVTKLLIILILILMLAGYLTYTQVRGGITISTTPPSTPRLEQGLVGHWTFDGGDILSSTTVRDLSNTRATGTLVNGPQKAAGRLGQGLLFDGVDDYVRVGDADVLSPSVNDVTVSVWVKVPTTATSIGAGTCGNTGRNILGKGGVGAWEFAIENDANSLLCFNLFTSGGSTYSTLSKSMTVNDGQWHHYTMVIDYGILFSVYLDGSSIVSTTSFSGSMSNTASNLHIGDRGSGDYFSGIIDDVRTYNRALSADEIRELYNMGVPAKLNSTASQPQGIGTLDSGLAGYWKLDEGSGTSAMDSSTNSSTGTLTGAGGPPTWTTGQISGAVDFDGADDYITVADTSVLDVTDGIHFTLAGWFNRDTSTTDDTILAKSNGQTAADTGYNVYIDDVTDKVTFMANDGTDQYKIESVSTFTATGWHHYTIVWDDSSSNKTKLYIDGVAEATTQTGTFGNINSLANAVTFRLGAESDAGNLFDGKLDEARIYNRALSADEASALYRTTTPTEVDTGLQGYWSFNGSDMSGTTVYDLSGVGNNGMLTSGPKVVIGKVGQGLLFDGVDDYVSINNSETAYQYPNTTITVTGWFKKSDSTTGYFITQGGCYGGWGAAVSGGTVQFKLVSSGSCGIDAAVRSSSSTTLNDGSWHHVVVVVTTSTTVSGDNDISIYIDGVLNQGAIARNGLYATTSAAVKLGVSSFAGGYFTGSLDEIRIYDRALSVDEISDLYQKGRGITVNAAAYTPPFICGMSTVQDADGNIYNTMSVGSQCWMKQNMRVGTRVSAATTQTNNGTIEKYCYSNLDANCTSGNPNYPDGALYQWNEAMQYSTTGGAQGICPTGWHIPTHDEFTTLERAVCTSGSCESAFPYNSVTTGFRGTDEGTKLQPNGTSGFEANLAGYVASGSFSNRLTSGIYWSSSESGANAWARFIQSGSAQVYRYAYVKTNGSSVRCLKN